MSTTIALLDSSPQSTHSDAEKLGAEITELCSYLYAAEARLLTLIRAFDEQKYWAKLGLCSCAHWLNFTCGIGMGAAREKVRVAQALAGLPKISEGFARGELSYSKVRAMTRIADESNEDYLMMIAHHGTAHHVEKLVSKFRTAKRTHMGINLQDTEVANEQYHKREVSHYYDHDGCLVIKARRADAPCMAHSRQWMSLSGLYQHPLRRWTSYGAPARALTCLVRDNTYDSCGKPQ